MFRASPDSNVIFILCWSL